MTREEAIRVLSKEACENFSRDFADAADMAITALHEQEERSKGCILCYPNKLCGTCKKFFDYCEDGGSDKCSACLSEEACAYYVPMGFCPVCGRKLVEIDHVKEEV